jgi:hypothetical protein
MWSPSPEIGCFVDRRVGRKQGSFFQLAFGFGIGQDESAENCSSVRGIALVI